MMRDPVIAVTLLLWVAVPAPAQTRDELRNDGKNSDNVLTYGMGYHQNRYSPLEEINKTTVRRRTKVQYRPRAQSGSLHLPRNRASPPNSSSSRATVMRCATPASPARAPPASRECI